MLPINLTALAYHDVVHQHLAEYLQQREKRTTIYSIFKRSVLGFSVFLCRAVASVIVNPTSSCCKEDSCIPMLYTRAAVIANLTRLCPRNTKITLMWFNAFLTYYP